MNEKRAHDTPPFQPLGKHLKFLREQLSETLAEVSGAIEIDIEHLKRIETGHERPPEDILMLLISHFNMKDQEAVQLWELAGYGAGKMPEGFLAHEDVTLGNKPVVMLLALDMRTVYTDGLQVDISRAGLTMNFTQMSGNQRVPVARLGMSFDNAEQVIHTLQQALLRAKYGNGPQGLPPGNTAA